MMRSVFSLVLSGLLFRNVHHEAFFASVTPPDSPARDADGRYMRDGQGQPSRIQTTGRAGSGSYRQARSRGSGQLASSSSSRRVMGHAPSELLEITVWVRADLGSCTLRNETPASSPSSITVLSRLPSQKPRP